MSPLQDDSTPGQEPAFLAAQRAFARHLRDPDGHGCPPHLPDARVEVYRYAVFSNIERFMGDNFPRVKEVLPAATWRAMVRDYLVRQPAVTPVFSRLPGEFLDYLRHRRHEPTDPPYLYELAHFDWLENVVSVDERQVPVDGIDPDGDLLEAPIVVNPLHRVETYRFPVQAINATFQPVEAPPRATHLVAFRDRAHRYGVIDLNAVSCRLFEAVRDTPERGARAILQDIAASLGQADPVPVLKGGLEILVRMRARELILGTRRH